jgi:hypothetical protein
VTALTCLLRERIAWRHSVNSKMERIPANVVDLNKLEAQLLEIDENLARLSPAERAAAITRRKMVYEELHPEPGCDARRAKAS